MATGAHEWTFLQGMGWKPNDVSSSFTQAGCFYSHPDNTAVVNVHIGHMKTAFYGLKRTLSTIYLLLLISFLVFAIHP